MRKQVPPFILNPENETYLRTRTGVPPAFGLAPVKNAIVLFVIFTMPAIAVLVGVGVYLADNGLQEFPPYPLYTGGLIFGIICGFGVVIYTIYNSVDNFMKFVALKKKGRLLKGQVESIKVVKEHLNSEHAREEDKDYFVILKVQYVFKSPMSGKIIKGKTQRRYLPEKVDETWVASQGQPCGVYYADDRYHVLL